MRLVPALAALLVTHVLFFHDVLFGHRSLSPATFTSGLTPSGPFGAPVEQLPIGAGNAPSDRRRGSGSRA